MSTLRDNILGAYDDTMSDYLESPSVKEASEIFNNLYFPFIKKIPPELRDDFHVIWELALEIAQEEADEAFYRGVILGIAEKESFKK